MADWCARERGSIQPGRVLRHDAYHQLGEAITRGEFEVNERPRATVRHLAVTWLKMTRERFGALPYGLVTTYLKYFWVPRELGAQWFAVRRIPLLSWLDDGKGDTASSVVIDSRGDA